MKAKKTILVLITLCCLLAPLSQQAPAAWTGAWYTCSIDQVGPYLLSGRNANYLYATSTDNPQAWTGSKQMIISSTRGKEYMASALTAFSTGAQIKVYIDLNETTPTIKGLLLQK